MGHQHRRRRRLAGRKPQCLLLRPSGDLLSAASDDLAASRRVNATEPVRRRRGYRARSITSHRSPVRSDVRQGSRRRGRWRHAGGKPWAARPRLRRWSSIWRRVRGPRPRGAFAAGVKLIPHPLAWDGSRPPGVVRARRNPGGCQKSTMAFEQEVLDRTRWLQSAGPMPGRTPTAGPDRCRGARGREPCRDSVSDDRCRPSASLSGDDDVHPEGKTGACGNSTWF
jgi:hypothetical protein